jgi:hypothetical protein
MLGVGQEMTDHRIWYLASPERVQPLVQTSCAFSGGDGVDTAQRGFCERGNGCLHADFHSFEWAESNVGEELS